MVADVPNYPGIQAAHAAIHVMLDDNAKGLGDRVVVGSCPKLRLHSRACDVRFVGATPMRLRVVVSKVADNLYRVRGSILDEAGR